MTRVITVQAIHIAPVKSLALQHPQAVHVSTNGILEDRRFYLVNQQGRLLTQREIGKLVQVKAEYQTAPDRLRLQFPGGTAHEGPVQLGEPVKTMVFGRVVRGHLVTGGWDDLLADFCGAQVSLVRSDEAGQCQDEYPISLMSQASVDELGRQSGGAITFDSRRFRPSFVLGGCEPHEEDGWLGGALQIGDELRLRLVARDPRCAITTHSPTTGERDVDTLRLILSYRPNPRAAYFGVYGIVERPGEVLLGDIVKTPTGVASEATP